MSCFWENMCQVLALPLHYCTTAVSVECDRFKHFFGLSAGPFSCPLSLKESHKPAPRPRQSRSDTAVYRHHGVRIAPQTIPFPSASGDVVHLCWVRAVVSVDAHGGHRLCTKFHQEMYGSMNVRVHYMTPRTDRNILWYFFLCVLTQCPP